MTSLDLSLPCPAENLALDEALLDAAEAGALGESLRFWESPVHFVVVGYANKVSTEVNAAECGRLGIPILRRCSGGGTVLQGPGVLNYSLVLRIAEGTPLAGITSANQFIMQRNADALTKSLRAVEQMEPHDEHSLSPSEGERPGVRGEENRKPLNIERHEVASSQKPVATANPLTLIPSPLPKGRGRTDLHPPLLVQVQGHTDLAINGLKFSGNAQRRKRSHLLFHGAILLNLDISLLEEVLPMPTLQPDYRARRPHRDFLTQLSISASLVKQALTIAWAADKPAPLEACWPGWRDAVNDLVTERYSTANWNLRV
jgi:lipoate-protein ligase A